MTEGRLGIDGKCIDGDTGQIVREKLALVGKKIELHFYGIKIHQDPTFYSLWWSYYTVDPLNISLFTILFCLHQWLYIVQQS